MEEAPWRTPLAQAFVEAGVELGYPNRDYNSRYQSGEQISANGHPNKTLQDSNLVANSNLVRRQIFS